MLNGPVQPGGHAVVRMAQDEKLGQPVAIKINSSFEVAAVEIEVLRTARSAVCFFLVFFFRSNESLTLLGNCDSVGNL